MGDGLAVGKLSWLAWPALLVLAQQVLFPAPAGSIVAGLVLGCITSLVALGMYLVYRANRVLNFAAGELGLLPAVIAVLLIVESGLSWYFGLVVGLAGAVVLGVAVEFLIIRRFFDAPRLVVTVATIGAAQLLGLAALLVPAWWDTTVQSQRVSAPFDVSFEVGTRVFNQNHLFVLIVTPIAIASVVALLRFTSLGVAIRATAELPARAALLGIPIKAIQGVVWSLATTLAFLALFMRAGVYGLPIGGSLGLLLLLRALAALTLGRLDHVPTILSTSLALGILQEGIVWNSQALESEPKMAAFTGGVIVVGLLARRTGGLRSALDITAWQSVGDARPVPGQLARLPLVRPATWTVWAIVAAAFLLLPVVGWFDTTVVIRMALIFLFAIIMMSLGILTGWTGQLSLGQMAFAAVGGAIGAWITLRWGWDITLATLAAGLIGATASLVIGLPALRLRGAYLAVTTLAFELTVVQFFVNDAFFDWVPTQRVERQPILGVIDWSSSRALYYVCLATLVLCMIAVHGIRNSRTGRLLVAIRDNEAAAEAYGVSPTRAKLTAFAVSGFFAAVAGSMIAHHQQDFITYQPGFSIALFTGAVVGGIGSIAGAVLGSLYWNGTFFWTQGAWRLFASGMGVLTVLLLAPAGIAGLAADLRDLLLRRWGRRHGVELEDRAEDLIDEALLSPEPAGTNGRDGSLPAEVTTVEGGS